MQDVVTACFDYSKLDEAKSPVRLRLNSTVTRVEHDGDPRSARRVWVTYVRAGQAWKKLGIGAVVSPGSYHINAMLDFPVSMGSYQFSGGVDEPVIVHMERFPHRSNEGRK